MTSLRRAPSQSGDLRATFVGSVLWCTVLGIVLGLGASTYASCDSTRAAARAEGLLQRGARVRGEVLREESSGISYAEPSAPRTYSTEVQFPCRGELHTARIDRRLGRAGNAVELIHGASCEVVVPASDLRRQSWLGIAGVFLRIFGLFGAAFGVVLGFVFASLSRPDPSGVS